MNDQRKCPVCGRWYDRGTYSAHAVTSAHRDRLRKAGRLMTLPIVVPAKKGDLAIVRRIGDGSGAMRTEPLIRWYVGRATKVDRTGYVREFEYPTIGGLQRQAVGDRGWGGGLDPYGVFIASARDVDVDMTLLAARAHVYPGHPGQPMPFETIEEVKAIVVVDFSRRPTCELPPA